MREKRRDEYLRKLTVSAPDVGRDWLDATADFLASGDNGRRFQDRAVAILRNPRMRDFCSNAERLFVIHNRERRERDERDGTCSYRFEFDGYRQRLIRLMAFEGGPLADETIGQITARRRKLAPLARRLADGLKAEPRLARGVYELAERLSVLADQLKVDNPLCALDPIERARSPWMPERRESAQQLLLERLLCDEFRAYTGGPRHQLVAMAVKVALDIDADPEGVKRREKRYRQSVRG